MVGQGLVVLLVRDPAYRGKYSRVSKGVQYFVPSPSKPVYHWNKSKEGPWHRAFWCPSSSLPARSSTAPLSLEPTSTRWC